MQAVKQPVTLESFDHQEALIFFSFWLGFLSQPFMDHRTAGEGGGHFYNSSLPLHLLHRYLDISRAITAESSPLHITGSRARTGSFGFREQVANYQATRALYELLNNKITSLRHVCHFGLITLTRLPSLCACFMDASSSLADFTFPLYFLVSCH